MMCAATASQASSSSSLGRSKEAKTRLMPGVSLYVLKRTWGEIESLKTLGSRGEKLRLKSKFLIGIARSAYLEPHLAILHRAL